MLKPMKLFGQITACLEKGISARIGDKCICMMSEMCEKDGTHYIHCMFRSNRFGMTPVLIVIEPDGEHFLILYAENGYNTNDLIDVMERAERKIHKKLGPGYTFEESDLNKFVDLTYMAKA